MTTFRRGMTVFDRRRVREDILVREIQRAHQRAREARRSLTCIRAMNLTGSDPATARELHARCKGEELGNGGCLCECHDNIESGIVTGSAGEPFSAER